MDSTHPYDEDALVPTALIPHYPCPPGDIPAQVNQARCPKTAGRTYYVCRSKQWKLKQYNEFRWWVPPPPNPLR
ncbi:hypothetical protein GQ55_8G065900 [Panicum hallii var. hallii]|uniref:Uncharacterized protein n=1 Tax=Panicum hallii var. hallii TaxID=1504633 RepID=A0A2T7CLC9_9POAL|nr:hypothetical protein GQ55_8G065900 [Panicum hallii var. hallii]